MDSTFHATVMQRPKEEEDEVVKRERINGEGSSSTRPPYMAQSPTQPDYRPPFSPTNGNPRPQPYDQYHPTPPALPMPTPSHIPGPASPLAVATTPIGYHNYPSATRDKPVSNYYDPTSDSSERRPSEAGRIEAQTPQVSFLALRIIQHPLLEDEF